MGDTGEHKLHGGPQRIGAYCLPLMLVRRRLPLSFVLRFAVPVGVVSGTWAPLVFAAYAFGGWGFLRVPFLPLSVMGTAVAFYVGFKNNGFYIISVIKIRLRETKLTY